MLRSIKNNLKRDRELDQAALNLILPTKSTTKTTTEETQTKETQEETTALQA